MYDKYYRDVSHLDGLDIYRILDLFEVTDHAIGHSVKKLLLSGKRTGGKTQFEDIMEARDTLARWMQMQEENQWAANTTTVAGATLQKTQTLTPKQEGAMRQQAAKAGYLLNGQSLNSPQ